VAFGAGVAVTGGVNKLPPVGLMLFSVLDGVVVVVDDGPPDPPLPQAVNVPIEMIAAIPTTAATRRVTRGFCMPCPVCAGESLKWNVAAVRLKSSENVGI
jgi:hypothetical protein